MTTFRYLLFSLFGFLLGSVLFSYHLPRLLKGVDIRALSEDHNPGAANAVKYAGIPVGMLCVFCDLFKGFLPVFLALRYTDPRSLWFALVQASPTLGHACAPLNHGRGGKAIAVTFGALLGLVPMSWLVFVLAAFYIFFSAVWAIHPNERRTVVTFSLFTAACVLGASYTGRWPFGLGGMAISAVVIHKNLRDAHLAVPHPEKQPQEP